MECSGEKGIQGNPVEPILRYFIDSSSTTPNNQKAYQDILDSFVLSTEELRSEVEGYSAGLRWYHRVLIKTGFKGVPLRIKCFQRELSERCC